MLAERLLSLAIALFCPELARMAQVDLDNIAMVLCRNGYGASKNGWASRIVTVLKPELLSTSESPSTSKPSSTQDTCLKLFYKVTLSTIVLEITGFYLSLWSLQWGAMTIIFSQIWFNVLAKVQLYPDEMPAVVPFGVSQRRSVLVANALGFGLLCAWSIQAAQVWLAVGLLVLVALFLVIKYGTGFGQRE